MKVLDYDYIKGLNISPQEIYDWCNDVWRIKEDCVLPPKVKMWQGDSGRYITMPCVLPDYDIAGVKFISRNVDDSAGVPARNSNIMIQNCSKMGLLAVTDGIWITNMRTGAIAAHSVIEYSKKDFKTLGIMGLGLAARAFMYIFGNIFKGDLTIKVLRYKDQAECFIDRFKKDFPNFKFEIVETYEEVCGCDSIVSAVGFARSTFVSDEVFKKGCLVVPIHTAGFQNCDLFFDKVFIDDYGHVKSFKYYDKFKDKAVEISKLVNGTVKGRESDDERIVVYCGGIALHDIYFAYKIYQIAEKKGDLPDFNMNFPSERFWI